MWVHAARSLKGSKAIRSSVEVESWSRRAIPEQRPRRWPLFCSMTKCARTWAESCGSASRISTTRTASDGFTKIYMPVWPQSWRSARVQAARRDREIRREQPTAGEGHHLDAGTPRGACHVRHQHHDRVDDASARADQHRC